MIRYTEGNLLRADVEALVNTVNTVGVMGKGIALMFKEAFPDNFRLYERAAKDGRIQVGKMFVTERADLVGPRWIINFPTKKHWRHPSRLEWIEDGLHDLRKFLVLNGVKSVALPPLGSGNGKLDWSDVRPLIEETFSDLPELDVLVYEPTDKYQNVAKRKGVDKLTPARALIAELVRRYGVIGIECTLLEIQKLAYFLEETVLSADLPNPLDLRFEAKTYGPYALRLSHLLDGLDGSYLHCEKRLADAGPFDVIWFDEQKRDQLALYLKTDASAYLPALDRTEAVIDGFESPLGLELLATVDWLQRHSGVQASPTAVRNALKEWPGGAKAGARKLRLFDERMLSLAIERLAYVG